MARKKSVKKLNPPEIVYVVIGGNHTVDGVHQPELVTTNAKYAEEDRGSAGQVARYRFECFVTVTTKTEVADMPNTSR